MNILVTGAAGFIGSQLCQSLVIDGNDVVGVDNMSPYYDVSLKEARVEVMSHSKNFHFYRISVLEKYVLEQLFLKFSFDCVVHLAAQAGIRYSYLNPDDVLSANIIGMVNTIELCRKYNVTKFVYASSSSVYGDCEQHPFQESFLSGTLLSPYAVSKKCCEDVAQNYCNIYGVPSVGLRFFTVYGPWGRPDMAPMIFAHALKDELPIFLYNKGLLIRDFTYIGDVIKGIECAIKCAGEGKLSGKHVIYNIGRGEPVSVKDFLSTLEQSMGRSAIIEERPKPHADVAYTHADITKARLEIGFMPTYTIEDGIHRFVEWFNQYYCDEFRHGGRSL